MNQNNDSLELDHAAREGETSQATFDWTDHKEQSTRIIEAVAAATGTDVTQLPPLYEYVDPEALNTLLEAKSEDRATSPRLSFGYAGLVIHVSRHTGIAIMQGQ